MKGRKESNTSVKGTSVKDVYADGVPVSRVALPRTVLFRVSL